ncbi:MAG TPA: TetR/AcrR family transcriptional regulator [Steroidobacteraceae bacterium]|jgi:AcrR family transcriptional regulator
MKTQRRQPRQRGRPPVEAEADIRNALLEAAHRLFLKHGFDKVTAREIALAAGTTPAMIHYYFTNKLGLFRAMLQQAIEPVRQQLAASLATDAAPPLDLRAFVTAYMKTAAANQWIATFVVNEVFPEHGRFRTTFIREVATPMMSMFTQVLERARAGGVLKADVDVHFAALSLLSLCIFPFISRNVTGPVLGVQLEGDALQQLIDHNVRVCTAGLVNQTEQRLS